jgi:ATP-binding cassette subfamily C protein LapB
MSRSATGFGPGDATREDVFDRIVEGAKQGAFSGGPLTTPAAEALIAVLERIGWNGGVREFAEAMPDDEPDFSVIDMTHALARLGWRATPWRLGAGRLEAGALPAVLVESDGAVSVLLGREGGCFGVRSAGGAVDERPVAAIRGEILVFTPMESAMEEAAASESGFLSGLAGRFFGPMWLLLWLTVLINLIALASALSVMAIYDKVIPAGAYDTLAALLAGVGGAVAIEIALRRVKARAVAQVAGRLQFLIATRIFQRLVSMPLEMTASLPIGAQVAKLRQFETVRDVFVGPIVTVGLELPTVLIMTLALAWLVGPLALAPLAVATLYGVIVAAMLPGIRSRSQAAAKLSAERQKLLLGTFTHMREIRSNGCADAWRERLATVSARAAMAQRAATVRASVLREIVGTASPLAGVTLLGLGALGVMEGAVSVGALVAAMLIVWRVLSPLQQLFGLAMRVAEIAQSFDHLDQFMRMKGEPRRTAIPAAAAETQGELRFADVSFRYPGAQQPALQGVSFTAPAGSILAVMGASSSGRTTLVRLALALHQPQGGAVLLDGLNLRQHDPRSQRAAIGYVPQSPALFRGTLADNLRLAAPGATRQEMAIACGRTRILKTILGMPQGFDTPVSDLGRERLSMGFRQSFALTQALMRNPKVLVLDEPGGALDVSAEDALSERLESLRGAVTILLVTRNLRHAAIADSILVLDRGRVGAFGPAEAVMRKLREGGRHAA